MAPRADAPIAHCAKASRTIAAIIFDAGGVLLHPDLDWIAAALKPRDLLPSRQQLLHGYYRIVFELDQKRTDEGATGQRGTGFSFRGLEIFRWFFIQLLQHLGAPDEYQAELLAQQAFETFPRESDIYHWALPGTAQQLQRLKERGFSLGVASNNDGALQAQLRSVALTRFFSSMRDSGVEGVAKPEPELLLRVARDLGVAPAHCLYVGDFDSVDGQAARAAKMAFALLDPLAQPRRGKPFVIRSLDEIPCHFSLLR